MKINNFNSLLWFFFATCLYTYGQDRQGKQFDERALWGSLVNQGISEGGRWVSYSIHYKSGADTLFVSEVDQSKKYSLPSAIFGGFDADKRFVYRDATDSLYVLDLSNGWQRNYGKATDFFFSSNNDFIVAADESLPEKEVRVISLKKRTVITIEGITAYSSNPEKSCIAYACGGTVYKLMLDDKLKSGRLAELQRTKVIGMAWQPDGSSLAMAAKQYADGQESQMLLYWRFDTDTLIKFPSVKTIMPPGKALNYRFNGDLSISSDGNRILIATCNKERRDSEETHIVEIWNSHDKRINSERKATGDLDTWPGLGIWDLKKNIFHDVYDGSVTHHLTDNAKKVLLVSHLESNEPEYKGQADRDFYLVDLERGGKTLLLKKFSTDPGLIHFSPEGGRLCYFLDKHWYLYDIKSQTTSCITCDCDGNFYNGQADTQEDKGPYGFAGWARDGSLFLNDMFDVYKFSVDSDGLGYQCLTKGRDEQRIYRLASDGVKAQEYVDLNANTVWRVTDQSRSIQGYVLGLPSNLKIPADFSAGMCSQLLRAKKAPVYSYISQDYGIPPSLHTIKRGKGKSQKVYQSNPHYNNYSWGKVQKIRFKKGDEQLSGVLCFPAHFELGKTYPMVVHIYERQGAALHSFVSPGYYESSGFNAANFTQRDYFVLLPDISFEIGNPGESALECVTAAIRETVSTAPVDKSKIGLIGASFGGFLCNYIMTRSDLFHTAVSGCGPSDLVSSYLSISNNSKKEEFWRYEYFQLRMGGPLYQFKERYLKNSPVLNADLIKAPMLSWTGLSDTQVSPTQSMELHLALRRMGKEHILLQYPGQNHAISDPKAQVDLNIKIIDWFDYHLKGKTKPEWMKPR